MDYLFMIADNDSFLAFYNLLDSTRGSYSPVLIEGMILFVARKFDG